MQSFDAALPWLILPEKWRSLINKPPRPSSRPNAVFVEDDVTNKDAVFYFQPVSQPFGDTTLPWSNVRWIKSETSPLYDAYFVGSPRHHVLSGLVKSRQRSDVTRAIKTYKDGGVYEDEMTECGWYAIANDFGKCFKDDVDRDSVVVRFPDRIREQLDKLAQQPNGPLVVRAVADDHPAALKGGAYSRVHMGAFVSQGGSVKAGELIAFYDAGGLVYANDDGIDAIASRIGYEYVLDHEMIINPDGYASIIVIGNPLVAAATMVNHSRDSPNARYTSILHKSAKGHLTAHVVLRALRDIRADEEVTVDYGDSYFAVLDRTYVDVQNRREELRKTARALYVDAAPSTSLLASGDSPSTQSPSTPRDAGIDAAVASSSMSPQQRDAEKRTSESIADDLRKRRKLDDQVRLAPRSMSPEETRHRIRMWVMRALLRQRELELQEEELDETRMDADCMFDPDSDYFAELDRDNYFVKIFHIASSDHISWVREELDEDADPV
jgi:hypothetical protein